MQYAGRWLGLAATLLAASHPLLAAEPTSEPELPIRLEYRAPSTCPSAADFERSVRAFLPKLEPDAAGADARSVEVEIDADGLHGVLTEQEPRGAQRSRAASGQNCAEVAQILAFAVALTIDPAATVPEGLGGKLGESFERTLPPSSSPTAAPTQSSQPAPPEQASDAAAPKKMSQSRRARIDYAMSASGFVMTAIAPRLSAGFAMSAERYWWFAGGASSVRLGLGYLSSESVVVDGATVRFRSGLGALEVCPRVWGRGSLHFGLCARVDGGARMVSAEDIPGARSRLRPWLDLGPTAHARWFPLRHLFFDLGIGGMFTAVQDRVYLRPDTTVHDAPSWGFLGELSLGLDFGDQSRD